MAGDKAAVVAPVLDAAPPRKARRDESLNPNNYPATTLGIFSLQNRFRRFCMATMDSQSFGVLVMVAVLVNTFAMSFANYNSPAVGSSSPPDRTGYIINLIESTTLVVFIVEACMRIVAQGVTGRNSYFQDNWNILDFVVIVTGIVILVYHETSSLSGIRCLRILRPLRTLRSFPGLRTLVNSLLSALPALANVAILLCFCYTVFAILGMGIWSGLYHGRCRLTEFPVRLNFTAANASWNYKYPDADWVATILADPGAYKCHDTWDVDSLWTTPQNCFWPIDPTDTVGQLCGARSCRSGTTCGSNYDSKGNPRFQDIRVNGKIAYSIMDEADYTDNLNFGLTSFDNIGSSLVIVLQTVTASGWMALVSNTQDSFSWVGAGVYFHVVLFFGMCFLLQINMAIMVSAFEVSKVGTPATEATQISTESTSSTLKRRVLARLPRTVCIKIKQAQADVCNSRCGQTYHAFRRRLLKILQTKSFHRVSFTFTLVNIGTLALHQHPMPPGLSSAYLEIIQFVCLGFFLIELIMQMSAHGPREFLRSGLNVFDFLSIVIGVADIVSNPPAFIDGTIANSNPFIALRALRAVKLAQSWRPLKRLMLAIGRTMSEFLNFLFFLVVFVYIFALLGMELFANRFYFDANKRPLVNNGTLSPIFRHRSHFDTIDAALFTVFQVITYDNWPAIMYDGWLAVGVASPVYFISIIVLGVWVVMNMFSAITVNSVMDAVESDPASEMKRSLSKMRYLERSVSRLELGPDTVKQQPVSKTKSEYALRTQHPLRYACLELTRSKAWTMFIIFVIGTASIVTAFETPLMDPHVGMGQLMDDINRVFAVLFSVEMAIELTANGVAKYLMDPWKVLDALITGVSLMAWTGTPQAVGGMNFGVIRSFRCLRALRPLRVINQLPQLKVVVNTLFRCVPDIGKALLFLLFSLFMFGIVSVLFYQGGMSSCSISPYNYLQHPSYTPVPPWFPPDYIGNYSMADLEKWDVMTFPKSWADMDDATRLVMAGVWHSTCPFTDQEAADPSFIPTSKQMCLCFSLSWKSVVPQSFDNVIVAMASLYELTTMEGWANVAFAAADCTGIDSQPLPNYSPFMLVFWVTFMVFCAFFMTNLFLGILCDSFIREKYGGFLTDDQIKWVNFQRKLIAIEPFQKIPRPTTPLRRWAFDLVQCEGFDIAITVGILLNMVALAISYNGQDPTMDLALNAINYAFSLVFLFEAVLKLFAVGPRHYFSRGWDCFDFFILMITIVSTILPFTGSDKQLNLGGGSMVVRVFRVGRALRLINKAKLMRSLFDTIIIALPAVGNVTGLLMLMYYIFAAVGVQLFAKVGYGTELLNRHQNFRTFWLALQTLIGFSTGENWDNFMWELYAVSPESNPTCADPTYNSSMCGFIDDLEGCEPLNGCGSWMIVPFMYLFELVVGYIGLNLFSGILVDAVADADAATSSVVMDLQDFARLWSEFDPKGTCRIELDELTLILKQMQPPLGYNGVPGYTFHRVRKELGSTGVMVYDRKFVHFREIPRALALRAVSKVQ
ncbi:hypothetical protein, variant 1 [Aphanomyces invadans]|uniref:EF-hand domain-containing protein n=1 Tax=Aphanomyces invadans TaxID=157072 RepID=A0A024UV55_9STRA|nr:hypothetical protein, variant 1 [Aphanomyces invadans]ETW09835.1 hypothetical protein, variant 1 [Aphanomyces invadans]|eukprot:XP_008861247.1 hypothetical protein, variant 1 [Aphanomyces invadans]